MLVHEVIRWYLKSILREYSPVAATERERIWRLFAALYGERKVEDCCAADLLSFIASFKGCASNHTRKRIRATICRPFNQAADMGLIARNPFRGVKIPRGRRGRDWTDSEYQAAMRCSAPHVRRLLVFLRFSGARPGEGRELTWEQIREEAACAVQQQHKTSHATDEPRRIYLNVVVVKLLAWLKRHKTHSVYVFTNYELRPWTIGALTAYINHVRCWAGLPGDLKLHGLRHTFATRAIVNGVDIRTLAELLGHATTRTTEGYTHLISKKDWLNDAANRAIRKTPPPDKPPSPPG